MISKKRRRASALGRVLAFTVSNWARERLLVGAIAVTITVATIADILVPVFAGRMVDAIAAHPGDAAAGVSAALPALGAMVGLGVTFLLFRHVAWSLVIPLTLRIMSRVSREGFGRVQHFSTDWHANAFSGSVVRQITRGAWSLDLLHDILLLALLPSAVVLVGTVALFGWTWPVMGLVTALGAGAYVIATILLSTRYVAPAARVANRLDTRVGGVLADALACNAVVKAFGAETREEERLALAVGRWRRMTRHAWMRATYAGTIQNALLWTMRIAIAATALWLWAEGRASPGDVTYVLTTYFVVHGYLREIGMHVNNLQRSVNEMEELVDLYEETPGVADAPQAGTLGVSAGEIRFEAVHFRYGQHATPLYDDLWVTIEGGERVGLVGHSGSGKTTFVKLIQRLYDVTGGRIVIDGQDIADVKLATLRRQIAIVPQEPILFHRSLRDNIAYGRPGATRAEIEHAAELASADRFIERLPLGYDTLVGERGVKLSGGERQRIALARAFLADAPILILDEATSSLDSESEALIQAAMTRLMAGRTALVIAHRLSTVRDLDRILVFDRGRIAEDGTHQDLLAQADGLYRGLCDRQGIAA
ncbi:ABC transporter ATP-binding protein [Aureimonas mangrovi]|uniref:ABC transporter ATP-binding protein n=1 Tax=Aureimonas mangrovi TaxID=2758041 RepID=UPI00163D53B8|nr:ABC transporter ATP-binding protein [Aureimonas mangrovi]